jgi:hypothetical protein
MISKPTSQTSFPTSSKRDSTFDYHDECCRDAKKQRTSTSFQAFCISEPRPHDVLCGRGGRVNKHIGNLIFRRIVEANKERYRSCKPDQKALLSRSIVEIIRNQTPPGRFLAQLSGGKDWIDVGVDKALQKTSQALREGSPDEVFQNAVSVASVSVGDKDSERSTRPSQDEINDEVLRRAMHALPHRRSPKKNPIVVASQPTTAMITKSSAQAAVSVNFQGRGDERTRSSPVDSTTMNDSSSKSSQSSRTVVSEEIQTSEPADSSQECLASDGEGFDGFWDDESFLSRNTDSFFFEAFDDLTDDCVRDEYVSFGLHPEFSYFEDHGKDERPMDCIAFQSSGSGEEWEV